MTSEVNPALDSPEAIERAMGLADLQIEMLGVDMARATRDSIEALFEGREGDPIAENMKEGVQDILELRNTVDDRELVELLFSEKARGRVDVETNAFSIAFDFHTISDWVRVAHKTSDKLLEMPLIAIPKGYAWYHGYNIGDLEGTVNINAHRAFGPRKLAPVKRHELRHSMNMEVSSFRPMLDFTDYSELPDDIVADTMVNSITRSAVEPLKDEIAAFIFGGNQSKLFLKLTLPLSPIVGLYDFNRSVRRLKYWKNHGLKGSVIKEVRERLKYTTNTGRILDESYAAVELLEQKGYTRDWAVSFLSVGENLWNDWLPLAEACPPRK